MTINPPTPPSDATLSVTRAAHVLGVHPNTIRTWSEQGRLPYFRINPRGDRRYRMRDLRRFLSEAGRDSQARIERAGRRDVAAHQVATDRARTTVPAEPPPTVVIAPAADPAANAPSPKRGHISASPRSGAAPRPTRPNAPAGSFAHLADLAAITRSGRDLDRSLPSAARLIRLAAGATSVSVWERVGDQLLRRADDGATGYPAQAPVSTGTAAAAVSTGQLVVRSLAHARDWPGSAEPVAVEAAVPIAGDAGQWGVLVIRHARPRYPERGELEWLQAAASLLSMAVRSSQPADDSGT